MKLIKNINSKVIYFLQIVWFSHFIQVLVPETGFDAVWYHLPVVDQLIKNKKIVFSPELYQSANPLFSDLFFAIGYYFLQDTGAKIIAYLFAVALVCITYKLSKLFLDHKLSMVIALLISTFQVISWQSSSFYVDVAKSFWEILSIYFLILAANSLKNKSASINSQFSKKIFLSIISFSASLATKLFSIFLLPFFGIMLLKVIKQKSKKSLIILPVLLLLPGIFYLNAFFTTSNPFYSFQVHLEKLSEIGGQSSLFNYFIQRTFLLVLSPLKLLVVKDYVSPLIVFLLVPLILKLKKVIRDWAALSLLLFSVTQWLLWWYLPPLSTRYALSGFITLLILEIFVLTKYYKKITKDQIIFGLIIFAAINFIPRIFVNVRSLNYLLTSQTKQEYLEQFYDGSIDQKLKDWHKI